MFNKKGIVSGRRLQLDSTHHKINNMFKYYLTSPGVRPKWSSIAHHLWGDECDFDSDGNADEALAGGWTELTDALRPECDKRVDVDPIDDNEPLVLVI